MSGTISSVAVTQQTAIKRSRFASTGRKDGPLKLFLIHAVLLDCVADAARVATKQH